MSDQPTTKTAYAKVFKALYHNMLSDYPHYADEFYRLVVPEIHYAMHNAYCPGISRRLWRRNAKKYIEAKLSPHEFMLVPAPEKDEVWTHYGDV